MRRFFHHPLPKSAEPHHADQIRLSDDQARHAAQVLRLEVGDEVELFDGQGQLATATITQIAKKQCLLKIIGMSHSPAVSPSLHLAVAPPKGQRLDTMIEKLSELGIDHWTPLHTDRSVVQPRDAKLDRLKKITIESAKQCKRLHTMQIHPVESLDDFLKLHSSTESSPLVICDTPKPDQDSIRLSDFTMATLENLTILIGPEGGWSSQETELFQSLKLPTWTFTSTVLRIETAAIAAASLLINERDLHL